MNLTSPILKGAVHAADLPGDSVTSFLKTIASAAGFLADDSPDGWLGMLMSGLSGVAAALAVAIILTVSFRSGYRIIPTSVRHGLAHAPVRFVILTLPGQAQYQFKLRLAANPSHSDQFGPWHLADRMASPNKGEAAGTELHDAFAIRYRVL